MKGVRFSLILLFLLAFAGLALANSLTAESAALDYEQPLKDIPKSGLVLSGESSSISCGVFECEYIFKVSNSSGFDLSDLQVKPYFSSEPVSYSIKELVEELVPVSDRVCISTKPIEGDVEGNLECLEWKWVESFNPVIVEKDVGVLDSKESKVLDSKEYVLEKQALVTLSNASTRVFKVKFNPGGNKIGQLVFVAESETLGSVKGSLDPWWNVSWERKKAIKISTKNKEIPLKYVFNTSIGATNTDDFQDDCDDIRIVDENTNRDLNISNIINCNTADTNVYWQFDGNNTLAKNKDYNATFYVYYKNAAATAKADWNNVDTIDVPLEMSSRSQALWHFENIAMDSNSYQDSNKNAYPMAERGTAPYNFSNTVRMFGRGYSAGAFGGGRYLLSPDGALPNQTRSVSFWYRPASVSSHQYVIIATGTSRLFFEQNADGTVRGSLDAGGTYITSVSKLGANQWRHIAYTWDGGASFERLYIDGVLDNQIGGGRSLNNTIADWGRDNGAVEHYTGYLDEVNIVNNTINAGAGLIATNLLHIDDTNMPIFTLGSSTSVFGEIIADFNYALRSPGYLDPGAGLNSVIVDFNDLSTDTNSVINDWNWYYCSSGCTSPLTNFTKFSDDQNSNFAFTTGGDYNIFLKVRDTNGMDGNVMKQINIPSVIQNLSITLDTNSINLSDLNIQFDLNASYTGSADTFWWQKNGAYVGTTRGLHQLITVFGDYNYCITAQTTGTDINKVFCDSIFITQLIVKRPLDEINLTVLTPFTISIDTNGTATYSDINNDTNVFFVETAGNIVHYVIIDKNIEFVSRTYGINANGNLIILQPYLLSVNDAVAVKFMVENELNEPVPNVVFNISKLIGGVKTLVASSITDATGISLFFLRPADKYYIDMNYNSQLVFSTNNYVLTTSPVYFYINTLTNYGNITPSNIVNVSFNPFVEFIQSGVPNIKIDINGSSANYAILKFYKFPDCNIYNDRNYFQVTSKACVGTCNFTVLVSSIHYDANCQFYAQVTVFSDNNTSQRVWEKRYSKFGSALNPINLFINARKDFGCSTDTNLPCPLTSVASIILIILAIGAIAFKFGFQSPTGLGVLTLMGLAFFTYVGWFYWIAFALIAVVLVIGLIGKGGE